MNTLSLLSLVSLLPFVLGHGNLAKVEADGVTQIAPQPWEQYKSGQSSRKGYASDESGTFALFASDFGDANKMACGPSTSNGAPNSIKVAAGSSVDLYWESPTGELDAMKTSGEDFHPWVHATGPVIDYLTSCDGDCSSFNAENAGWTKMAEFGVDQSQTISGELRGLMAAKPEVYQPTSGSGLWGMAKMIQDGSKWTLQVPSDLKPGQYLWRNEITAMHTSPAQIYVGCQQIEVTGSGSTELPAGTKADQLYFRGNIFENFNAYTYDYSKPLALPGPAVWNGASSGSSAPAASKSDDTSAAAESTDTSAEKSTEVNVNVNVGGSNQKASEDASTPDDQVEAAPASNASQKSASSSSGSNRSCRRKRSRRSLKRSARSIR